MTTFQKCVLIILGLFTILLGFLLLTPGEAEPQLTENLNEWATYVDNEYKFTIEHPARLKKEISNRQEQFEFGTQIKDISFSKSNFGVMGVKIYTNLKFNDFESFLKIKNNHDEFTKYVVGNKFHFAGTDAIIYSPVTIGPEGNVDSFTTDKRIIFLKEGTLFEIWSHFGDNADFEKMLHSFLF